MAKTIKDLIEALKKMGKNEVKSTLDNKRRCIECGDSISGNEPYFCYSCKKSFYSKYDKQEESSNGE